jgi:hypothetical protein
MFLVSDQDGRLQYHQKISSTLTNDLISSVETMLVAAVVLIVQPVRGHEGLGSSRLH